MAANNAIAIRGVADFKHIHAEILKMRGLFSGLEKSMHATAAAGADMKKGFDIGNAFFGFWIADVAIRSLIRSAGEWEQAMAGVSKTTDITGDKLKELADDLTKLSIHMGENRVEIAAVAQAAGQLGIQGKDNILDFTEAIQKLAGASDLASEEGAMMLARFMSLTNTPTDNIKRISSAIVELGNNVAATEHEITYMSTVLAQATSAFGLSAESLLSMSAVFASSGLEATATATAVNKFFVGIATSAREGGEALKYMADAMDLTREQAQALINTDIEKFAADLMKSMGGLNQHSQVNLLSIIGIQDIRTMKAILSGSKRAYDEDALNKARGMVYSQTDAGEALEAEYSRKRETFMKDLHAQGAEATAAFGDFAASLTGVLTPAIEGLVQAIKFVTEDLRGFGDALASTWVGEAWEIMQDWLGIKDAVQKRRQSGADLVRWEQNEDLRNAGKLELLQGQMHRDFEGQYFVDFTVPNKDFQKLPVVDHAAYSNNPAFAKYPLLDPSLHGENPDVIFHDNLVNTKLKQVELQGRRGDDTWMNMLYGGGAFPHAIATETIIEEMGINRKYMEDRNVSAWKTPGMYVRSLRYDDPEEFNRLIEETLLRVRERIDGAGEVIKKYQEDEKKKKDLKIELSSVQEEFTDKRAAVMHEFFPSTNVVPVEDPALLGPGALPANQFVAPMSNMSEMQRAHNEQLMQAHMGIVSREEQLAEIAILKKGVFIGKEPNPQLEKQLATYEAQEEFVMSMLQLEKEQLAILEKNIRQQQAREEILKNSVNLEAAYNTERLTLMQNEDYKRSTGQSEKDLRENEYRDSEKRAMLREIDAQEAEAMMRQQIQIAEAVEDRTDEEERNLATMRSVLRLYEQQTKEAQDLVELTKKRNEQNEAYIAFAKQENEYAAAQIEAAAETIRLKQRAAEEVIRLENEWNELNTTAGQHVWTVEDLNKKLNETAIIMGSVADAAVQAWQQATEESRRAAETIKREWMAVGDSIANTLVDPFRELLMGGSFTDALAYSLERLKAELMEIVVIEPLLRQLRKSMDGLFGDNEHSPSGIMERLFGGILGNPQPVKRSPEEQAELARDTAHEATSQAFKEMGKSDAEAERLGKEAGKKAYDETLLQIRVDKASSNASDIMRDKIRGVSDETANVVGDVVAEAIRTNGDSTAEVIGNKVYEGSRAGVAEGMSGSTATQMSSEPGTMRVPQGSSGTPANNSHLQDLINTYRRKAEDDIRRSHAARPDNVGAGGGGFMGIIDPTMKPDNRQFEYEWKMKNPGIPLPDFLGNNRHGQVPQPAGGGFMGNIFGGGGVGIGSILTEVLLGKVLGVDMTHLLASNLFGGQQGGMNGLLGDPIKNLILSKIMGIDLGQMLMVNMFRGLGVSAGGTMGNLLGNDMIGGFIGNAMSGYAMQETLGLDSDQVMKMQIFDLVTGMALPKTSGGIVPSSEDPGLNGGIIPQQQNNGNFLGNIMQNIFGGQQGGGGLFDIIGNMFGGGGEGGGMGGIFSGFLDGLTSVFDGVLGGFGGLFDGVLGSFGGIFDGLGGMFSNLFGGGGMGGMMGGLGSMLGGMGGGLGGMMGGLMGGLGGLLGGGMGMMGGMLGALTPMLGALGPFGLLAGGLMALFEDGGEITKSGYAIVGEGGPEIVKLPRGAEVYPNGTVPTELAAGKKLALNSYTNNPLGVNAELKKLYGLSTGGRVTRSGEALVGEEGAEVVKLPTGSMHLPTESLPQQDGALDMVANISKDINLSFNVNGVKDPGIVRAEINNMMPLIERVVKNSMITDTRSPTRFAKAVGSIR